MISKQQVIERALALGFADVGFTTAEPFASQLELLNAREEEYAWTAKLGLDLKTGCDPSSILPDAKSIIVLVDAFCRESYPAVLESHFGRAYLDDDRRTKDRAALRVKSFLTFLKEAGIAAKLPFNLPHRLSAARAGVGTLGKNCLFFAERGALGASWVTPLPIVVNAPFDPDPPSVAFGCPQWCRNACVAACPTRALAGDGTIDPRRCISHLSHRGEEITPREFREPMGIWVYGCDRCQNVCPRNALPLAQVRPPNPKVAAMEQDFELTRLLHMDREYFEARILPHMFYTPADDLWRWKMNVARAMGNSRDARLVPELIRAYRENDDDRVRGMLAWALGRLGGSTARAALNDFRAAASPAVREEVQQALSEA